jgi:hypothetical protein
MDKEMFVLNSLYHLTIIKLSFFQSESDESLLGTNSLEIGFLVGLVVLVGDFVVLLVLGPVPSSFCLL